MRSSSCARATLTAEDTSFLGGLVPIPRYVQRLREKVGHDLIVLVAAGVAILDVQGRLLLCKHSDFNRWDLPGGVIEPGEAPSAAAIRETFEEIGVDVQLTGILGAFGGPDLQVNYSNGDKVSYVLITFRARITAGELKPDGEEILDVRYFSREDLGSVDYSKWMDGALSHLFSNAPAGFA
jgi:8-oxo-dGTP pyrophosphatase MutT (NUDIX family)